MKCVRGMTTDSTDRNGHLSYFDRVKKVLSGPTEDFEKLSNQANITYPI